MQQYIVNNNNINQAQPLLPLALNAICTACTTYHLAVGLPFGPLPWAAIFLGCGQLIGTAISALVLVLVLLISLMWIVMPIIMMAALIWIAFELRNLRLTVIAGRRPRVVGVDQQTQVRRRVVARAA
jgi:hypothetical protein